ncbi:hypothetical protein D3C73_554300 [compost metagenome]
MQFATQASDQHVDGTVVGHPFAVADLVHQLIAAEGVAAVAQEHAEQLVFAVGQQGFVARWIDQATAVGVQCPIGELLDRFGLRNGWLWYLRMTYPANQVFRPGHQFPWIEGFDHIVIGAAFEADDAVDFIVTPGDQDDPDLRTHP